MGFVDDVIMGEPGTSKIDISALVIDLAEQLPDPQPVSYTHLRAHET